MVPVRPVLELSGMGRYRMARLVRVPGCRSELHTRSTLGKVRSDTTVGLRVPHLSGVGWQCGLAISGIPKSSVWGEAASTGARISSADPMLELLALRGSAMIRS